MTAAQRSRHTAAGDDGPAADVLTRLGLGDRPTERLADLVAAQLGVRQACLLSVRVHEHPYARPAITTASRHLVDGTADDGTGHVRDYAFFVKVVRAWGRSPLAAAVPEPLRSQLAPLVPWRTEPDLYRSDLSRRLPPGLRLARVFEVVDLATECAAVWLERLPLRDGAWDVEQHATAARLLGRLAARPDVAPLSAQVPVARTARAFAEHWLGLNVVPDLLSGDLWRDPAVAAAFDAPLRRRLAEAARTMPALVDALETFPVLTAHGDACPDNLLVTTDGDDLVLVDFGFWGTAPVGFDLGQLVLGEIQLGRRPADTFAALEAACLPAYVAGLRDEGCTVPADDVRRAHALALTVFHAVPAVPYEDRAAAPGPERQALLDNRAVMARGVLDLLDATA